jgi:hypothetical protein
VAFSHLFRASARPSAAPHGLGDFTKLAAKLVIREALTGMTDEVEAQLWW